MLWGHSSGWLVKDSVPYTRAYGVDNGRNDVSSNDGKWLNLPTMARVLQNLPHFKFIFADCCNFMCLESLYELRNVADYIIGSPAEIPAEGAPYSKMLPAMFLQDDDFYTAIVDRCYEQKAKGLYLPLSVAVTEERYHGVSMFVPQSPFGGYYSFYNRNIRQFAWYYAVNDKAGDM